MIKSQATSTDIQALKKILLCFNYSKNICQDIERMKILCDNVVVCHALLACTVLKTFSKKNVTVSQNSHNFRLYP